MNGRDEAAFLRRFFEMEASLVAAGFAPLPEWWRATITRFYLSKKRRLVVRKGRRVFASTSVAPRLAVAEALFGEHRHILGTPPHTYAFLSIKRSEAALRLRGVAAILDALGIKYAERGDSLEFKDFPAVFAVVTANFRTSVGETAAFAWADEVSRWRDDDSGANPAEQVVGSLAPALATLPDARLFLVSSPLGPDDFHARSFELGETELQSTAFGTTWEINPNLTQEETRRLEPDEKIWRREYAAVPSAAVSAAFDSDAVGRAFRVLPPGHFWPAVGVVDASSGGGDAFTYAVARYFVPAEPYRGLTVFRQGVRVDPADGITPLDTAQQRPLFTLEWVASFEGRFKGQLTGDFIVGEIAKKFRRAGVTLVVGDQRESLFLASAFSRERLRFREIAWTNELKSEAVRRIRRQLSEDAIVLPPERERLRKELISYSERISPSGVVTYSARGTGHDDEAALLLTATMADAERLIPGSPLHARPGRHEVSGR